MPAARSSPPPATSSSAGPAASATSPTRIELPTKWMRSRIPAVRAGNQWRLTGGGFTAGASVLGVSGSQPQDLFSSLGDEDSALDDYWRTEVQSSGAGAKFTGYAICAKLEALSYNRVTVPPGVVTPTTVSDQCPGRTVPTGGGGSSGFDGPPIISMYPDGGNWTLVFDGTVSASSFALNDYICLGPKGIRTETKSTKLTSLDSKSIEAECSGKRHVVGGGLEVGFPSAAITFASFPIDAGDRDKVPDDGWRVGAQSTTTQKQTLRAYAICKG